LSVTVEIVYVMTI